MVWMTSLTALRWRAQRHRSTHTFPPAQWHIAYHPRLAFHGHAVFPHGGLGAAVRGAAHVPVAQGGAVHAPLVCHATLLQRLREHRLGDRRTADVACGHQFSSLYLRNHPTTQWLFESHVTSYDMLNGFAKWNAKISTASNKHHKTSRHDEKHVTMDIIEHTRTQHNTQHQINIRLVRWANDAWLATFSNSRLECIQCWWVADGSWEPISGDRTEVRESLLTRPVCSSPPSETHVSLQTSEPCGSMVDTALQGTGSSHPSEGVSSICSSLHTMVTPTAWHTTRALVFGQSRKFSLMFLYTWRLTQYWLKLIIFWILCICPSLQKVAGRSTRFSGQAKSCPKSGCWETRCSPILVPFGNNSALAALSVLPNYLMMLYAAICGDICGTLSCIYGRYLCQRLPTRTGDKHGNMS